MIAWQLSEMSPSVSGSSGFGAWALCDIRQLLTVRRQNAADIRG